MMKVLLLVQKEQRVILDRLYAGIEAHSNCDTRYLTGAEQSGLRKYFKENVDVNDYDRIVLFLRFKKELRQIRFIRTIPNLVILEHDAYQNYIDCKYKDKFSWYYSKVPWARVLSSGATVTRRLQEEGFDVVFVPKGYDEALMQDYGLERDIELGFVGSVKSATYSKRKVFLEQLAQEENMLITRTNSGDEYVQMLNRIRFFVSADVGMEEYMIKNFEAMACGCVLFAYNQGEVENGALGFQDMENIVLYSSVNEFRSKLAILRGDLAKALLIAENGKKLVQEKYTYAELGKQIVENLRLPLRDKKVKHSLLDKLLCRIVR